MFVIKLCGQLLLTLAAKMGIIKMLLPDTQNQSPRFPAERVTGLPPPNRSAPCVNAGALNRNRIAQAYPFLICNMSLAERQAKRTWHIDESPANRKLSPTENWLPRNRETEKSRNRKTEQRPAHTLCCAFCWALPNNRSKNQN